MRNEETHRRRESGRIRITSGRRNRLLLIRGGYRIYNFAGSQAVPVRLSGKGKLEARYSLGRRKCDSRELIVSSQGKT